MLFLLPLKQIMLWQHLFMICRKAVRWVASGGRNLIVVLQATRELELDPLYPVLLDQAHAQDRFSSSRLLHILCSLECIHIFSKGTLKAQYSSHSKRIQK